jgi:uncharacterized protein YjgD (DUF1641 family)
MAQPILQHRVPTDRTSALQARLAAAPVEHADAILAAYKLLQELQDHGVIDLLRGMAGSGGEIVTRLSDAANTPEPAAAIRNIVSMLRILGSIDPDILHDVAEIVTKRAKVRGGIWKALRAVGAAAYGVQIFGRVLISRRRRMG